MKSNSNRTRPLGVFSSDGKGGKSAVLAEGLIWLPSERILFHCNENGLNSPRACAPGLLGVRFGVDGMRKAFAAEEKKSPVVGRVRSGVMAFLGVLKSCELGLCEGVGVVGRLTRSCVSSNKWSKFSSSSGGQFSLSDCCSSSCDSRSKTLELVSRPMLPGFELDLVSVSVSVSGIWSPFCFDEGNSTRLVGFGVRASTSIGDCFVPMNRAGED